MSTLIRTMARTGSEGPEKELLLSREWLVTNGLGGYASGTVPGIITRRFHGLLIAALPSPFGRRMMLNDLQEQVRFPDGTIIELGGEERVNVALRINAVDYLSEFRLEMGLPIWTYKAGGVTFEKRLVIPYRQNTVHLTYRIVDGDVPIQIDLRPAIHFRAHEGALNQPFTSPYVVTVVEDRYEFSESPELPSLRMMLLGNESAFTFDGRMVREVLYRIEESRGYESQGDLWSPGYFHAKLVPGQTATLIASTESWEMIRALGPGEAESIERERRTTLLLNASPAVRDGMGAELVLAADQFIITPAGRVEDSARAHAAGNEVRTVIAGYHWFTDWGRDTMISLEGLTLATGRATEAGWILRTFAYYVRDGLIPNMFPEGKTQGLYHTADASLWFFQAMAAYLAVTNDRRTLRVVLPKLQEIVQCHLQGTRFGIHVDSADGLLHQGAEGYQLTWMDAKVDGWVVTPRRGKAVEINALWYNALMLLQGWVREEQSDAAAEELVQHARRARESFNHRFWYEQGGYLYDIVDGENGDNTDCRPNQVFAISLRNPVLDRERWEPVMRTVRDRLLTPVGLRSLAPGSPDYKSRYDGDLRSRDAAYHQGTVWGWLIGPYIDAYLKLNPDDHAGARDLLKGFEPHLGEACIGSISEVFDAEPPYTPRGCVAQAWSVAEALRCWVKTAQPVIQPRDESHESPVSQLVPVATAP